MILFFPGDRSSSSSSAGCLLSLLPLRIDGVGENPSGIIGVGDFGLSVMEPKRKTKIHSVEEGSLPRRLS